MAYCPSCVSYGVECEVDQEDWNSDCGYYKPRVKECPECSANYDIEVGCIYCEARSFSPKEQHKGG